MLGSAALGSTSLGSNSTSANPFIKIFTESLLISENISNKVSRMFFGTLELSDLFSSFKVVRAMFMETISLSENLTRKITRSFSEQLEMVDNMIHLVAKLFLESISLLVSFSSYKIVFKVFIEAITICDVFTKYVNGLFNDVWTKSEKISDEFSVDARDEEVWTKDDKEDTIWKKNIKK